MTYKTPTGPVRATSSTVRSSHVKSKVRQRPSGRNGEARTVSPEIREQANFILQSKGESAMNDFLNGRTQPGWKPELGGYQPIVPEDSNPEPPHVGTSAVMPNGNGTSGGGTICAAIAEARERVRFFEKEVQRCQEELGRWRDVEVALVRSHAIATAPRKKLGKQPATTATE